MSVEYHIYKVYINDKYYVPVAVDPYPKRALLNFRKSAEYKYLFGEETANVLFVKTIKVSNLHTAKIEKKSYVENNLEYIENLRLNPLTALITKVSKNEKVKPIKHVAHPHKLQVLIKVGVITKADVNELMIYNELKKQERRGKPLFDRDLLTYDDREALCEKYNKFDKQAVRKADDLYYCECCKLLMNPNNHLRHDQSKGHMENSKNEQVKEPIMVD